MACHKACLMCKQGRTQNRAGLESQRAAWIEAAARWRAERRWQFALEHYALALALGVRHRRRREQGARIGMLRVPEYAVARAIFGDAAEIHHHHVSGDMAYDRQIVADEEISEIEPL